MSKIGFSSNSKMGKVSFINLECFHHFFNQLILFNRGKVAFLFF